MPWKTARDNVAIGLEVAGVAAARGAASGAEPGSKRVGLAAFGDRYPHQLSGGQRKRVGLAQVLIRDPKILLMDEPFGPLDAQTRQIMGNLLLELWAGDRKAVLFVTHDLEEAIALADRVVIMSAGPAARIIGDHAIDLGRPRDASEVRLLPRFHELHKAIWGQLRAEVLKAYARRGRMRRAAARLLVAAGAGGRGGDRASGTSARACRSAASICCPSSSSPRPVDVAHARVDAVRRRHGQDRQLPGAHRHRAPAQHRRSLLRQDGVAASADHADRRRAGLRHRRGGRRRCSASGWRATPLLSAIFDPYIKMLNALPRVVLAPIFMLWLGLGIWSKVALGVTLVFFIVFFNVYQGVKEVSPVILANARMLGMSERQLFAPRLLALGAVLDVLLAAHLGRLCHHRRRGRRVPGLGRGPRLPDPAGRGHLRHDRAYLPAW